MLFLGFYFGEHFELMRNLAKHAIECCDKTQIWMVPIIASTLDLINLFEGKIDEDTDFLIFSDLEISLRNTGNFAYFYLVIIP